MLDEQIVNILLKYKDENSQEIVNINHSINSIKGELESIFEYVSNEFSKELFDLSITKENNILLQDARCLKEYCQNFDNFLIPVNNKENSLEEDENNSNNNETVQSSKEPDEYLELYLTPDEVCPCCHASMNNVKDYYYNSSEKDYKQISIFKCDNCDKKYVTFRSIKGILNNLEYTNIILHMKYHHLLDIYNKIYIQVQKTIKSCINKKHQISDITVQIPMIHKNGTVGFEILPATYCNQCQKYIMLKDDFDKIEGIILCEVIDETTNENESSGDFSSSDKQSELYRHGYNVQAKKGLSETQRHIILLSLINSNKIGKGEIYSYLGGLIEKYQPIPKFSEAVKKWKDDRDFVAKSNSEDIPSYVADKIILKFSCQKSIVPY